MACRVDLVGSDDSDVKRVGHSLHNGCTSSAAQAAPLLRLQRGTFDARQPTPASLQVAWWEAAPGSYAIVQFNAPPTAADRERLKDTGVQTLEYLPDYAYLVQGKVAQLNAVTRLPGVYATTPLVLADKLSPALLSAVQQGKPIAGTVRIIGWPDQARALEQELHTLNMTDTRVLVSGEDVLMQIARLPSVRWIEYALQPRLLNDVARTIMQVDPVWTNYGLFGSNQLVAVADSGLDTGNFGTLSPDFAGRISATHVLSAGADWGDNFGHGTHVAGSIAGAGVQSGASPAQHAYTNTFAGVAPEAHLVIQAFEADSSTGEIIGLDPDYYQLFAQAYADGARLHSDSWGDYTGPITDTEAQFGGYPFGAQRTDQFVWEHPDMAIFVAAGNSGVHGVPGHSVFAQVAMASSIPIHCFRPAPPRMSSQWGQRRAIGPQVAWRDLHGFSSTPAFSCRRLGLIISPITLTVWPRFPRAGRRMMAASSRTSSRRAPTLSRISHTILARPRYGASTKRIPTTSILAARRWRHR